MSYTITETYTLPSHGKIYDVPVEERVQLRSMTTEEEMRRLSHTDTPYKTLCDIIDACIVNNVGISSYDMCLGDYQFLLYKLRTVTYGSEYLNGSVCPHCGKLNPNKINLDSLEVLEYNEKDWEGDVFTVTLPQTGKVVKLGLQTPRSLDKAESDAEEFNKRNPENKLDMSILFNIKNNIKSIDRQHYDEIKMENFIRKLPMRDTNKLSQAILNINGKVGVINTVTEKCGNPQCGKEYLSSFRITSEFFGPTED